MTGDLETSSITRWGSCDRGGTIRLVPSVGSAPVAVGQRRRERRSSRALSNTVDSSAIPTERYCAGFSAGFRWPGAVMVGGPESKSRTTGIQDTRQLS